MAKGEKSRMGIGMDTRFQKQKGLFQKLMHKVKKF
jgi:hypothetical protein